jgi:hypothetical protein
MSTRSIPFSYDPFWGAQDDVEPSASSPLVSDRFTIWRDVDLHDATWQCVSSRVELLGYPLFMFMRSTRWRSGYCDAERQRPEVR